MARGPGKGLGWVKPGVPRSVHLFVAPLLWTLIGASLLVRGWSWLGTGQGRWWLALAIALGSFKSLFILDRVARKSMQRLIHFQDGTCLGAIYSWQSWSLVLLMMVAGFLLRRFTHPGQGVGILYCAVGWSLCFSSRLGWRQWLVQRTFHDEKS